MLYWTWKQRLAIVFYVMALLFLYGVLVHQIVP